MCASLRALGDGASPDPVNGSSTTRQRRRMRARSAAAEAVEHLLDGSAIASASGLTATAALAGGTPSGCASTAPLRLSHDADSRSAFARAITGSRSSTTRHWPITSATAFWYSSLVAVAGSSALSASMLACSAARPAHTTASVPCCALAAALACALADGLEHPASVPARTRRRGAHPARAGALGWNASGSPSDRCGQFTVAAPVWRHRPHGVNPRPGPIPSGCITFVVGMRASARESSGRDDAPASIVP